MPLILAYYTNLVIADHSGATNVCHLAALSSPILVLMRFPFLTEHIVAGYSFFHPNMVQRGSNVNNPFFSVFRHLIYYHGWAKLLAGWALDPAAPYLVYRRSL